MWGSALQRISAAAGKFPEVNGANELRSGNMNPKGGGEGIRLVRLKKEQLREFPLQINKNMIPANSEIIILSPCQQQKIQIVMVLNYIG